MSSQETDHVSPTEVTGSGHLAAFSVCLGGRLDKTGTHANDGSRGEAVGKPGVAGVYTNQRLNLSKPWKGLRMTCQGFKPDPGNLAVRHYRGASRNIRNGETVNPPAIERAGSETPHLQQGALDLYPNRRHHSKPATRLDPTRLPLADICRVALSPKLRCTSRSGSQFPLAASHAVPLSEGRLGGTNRLRRDSARNIAAYPAFLPILLSLREGLFFSLYLARFSRNQR